MSMLKDIFKQMMNGFEHENAAENLSLRQKKAYLNKNPRVAVPVTTEVANEIKAGSNQRHVALYMGSELSKQMMEYVLETCASLKHSLTVVTFQTEATAQAMMQPYQKALRDAGIKMTMATLTGDPMSKLKKYLKGHPEVAFLACKETGYLAHSYMNGPKDKNLLPVPVVVVSDKANEAEMPTETTASNAQDDAVSA